MRKWQENQPRVKGNLTAVIGKSIAVNSLVPEISVDQGVIANDTLDQGSGQEGGCIVDIPHSVSNHSEAGYQAIDDHIVRDDHIADNGLIDELIIRDEDFDCHSEDSNDDSILIGNYKEDNVDQVGSEPKVETSNWRGLFQTVNSLSKLEYFAPKITGGKCYKNMSPKLVIAYYSYF